MTVREYLKDSSPEELTTKLRYIDWLLLKLHNKGFYLMMNLNDAEIIDGEFSMKSPHNKFDYVNGGIDSRGINRNFIQLCVIGLCAYNHVTVTDITDEFLRGVIYFLDKYLACETMPEEMREYYKDVFKRNNLDSVNNFIKEYYENNKEESDKGRAYVKRLPGTEIPEDVVIPEIKDDNNYANTGYASILLVPALLALIYIVTVVVYFVFIK